MRGSVTPCLRFQIPAEDFGTSNHFFLLFTSDMTLSKCLTLLCLIFLICKMGRMVKPISQSFRGLSGAIVRRQVAKSTVQIPLYAWVLSDPVCCGQCHYFRIETPKWCFSTYDLQDTQLGNAWALLLIQIPRSHSRLPKAEVDVGGRVVDSLIRSPDYFDEP